MLTQLVVNNFTIVNHLSIDFYPGMTAITGETGAGKSLSIDALNLCLGARADASFIRQDCDRIDISAHFQLDDTPTALSWLKDNQLDDGNECILRRVINIDGRSKGFVNGRAVPLSQLKEVGQMLIQIHGQHEHQLLLRQDYQHALLDQYMNDFELCASMKQAFSKWKRSTLTLKELEKRQEQQEAQVQLLQYQLKELNEFAPIKGEYEQIDEEYKKLSNSDQLLQNSQQLIDLLADNSEVNLLTQLNQALYTAKSVAEIEPQLNNIITMLDEASIQIKEAHYELQHYVDNLEIDPQKIIQLETRLSKQIALARKHHVQPQELPDFHQKLLEQEKSLSNLSENYESLKQEIEVDYQKAIKLAKDLHQKREKTATILAKKITSSIQELSMPHGKFEIEVIADESKLNELGYNQVLFKVSTNPGQQPHLIAKVASGGELSRIALAIQVLTAQKMETPALIFDEIDVGISGPTAAKVGSLLRQLGQSTQVICVTHLPQVAGNAHHHFFVSKKTDKKQTQTEMIPLTKQTRLEELARLLGGDKITENTLANASDLLVHSS